ncbi:Vacuolar protein sorting-associated protein [Parasponia andersonii]|uniref:Vacuolar protein sorting-associated protein n=1 Tax=Parasponia andersonii TaxID=3476 RepID=A0A2P5BME6_PARAD|nr:Vacuolar protein sorting-associated protein [Parasponia andersonii]
MTVATVATTHTRKLMKLGLSLFRRGFNASKCKTAAKMAVARIKLLRNKRQVVVKQMRRDIALLLQSGQDATARIRVEHVIREQNVLAANEFIELFCELVVTRLSIISKRRECPADLKEGIASLIFAAPRCSEIPELVAIRDVFEKKYGKDFISAATDLRPNCGVNRALIDKLSVRNPTGEFKLKIMKEIAKEYQIEWDTKETEMELLKPPEELIGGPCNFVSATSLPVTPVPNQSVELNKSNQSVELNKSTTTRTIIGDNTGGMHFQDTASAAKAAAKCANEAIAAAKAAAFLANKDRNQGPSQATSFDHELNSSSINVGYETTSVGSSIDRFMPDGPPITSQYMDNQYKSSTTKTSESESYVSHYLYTSNVETGKMHRRHGYNAPSAHSDIKFDESDCDEEFEAEAPPERSPPAIPSSQVLKPSSVHPKLPDYDSLAARFQALKYRKSQT